MSTISEIQTDLDRGKLFYSELNSEHIDDLNSGCQCELPANYKCLRRLIKAIEWKVSQGVVDDILEKLYFDLLIIIGEAPIVTNFTVNYGFYDTPQIPSTIVFTLSKQVPVGSTSFTLDFTSAVFSSDKYIAFDQPSSEVTKTTWVNDPAFNYGTIPDSVFNSVVEVNNRKIVISRTPFVAFTNNSNVKFSN